MLQSCLDKELPVNPEKIESDLKLKEYDMVILTDSSYEVATLLDLYCRKNGIKFVACAAAGPFSWTFNDFGDKFTVLDKTGEDS